MSSSCVHLCFNLIGCEGTTNTRFTVSNCAVYLADSCLISCFLALFTSSRSRILVFFMFSRCILVFCVVLKQHLFKEVLAMVADSSHLVSAFPRTLAFWARMRVCENNQREREKYADARIRERKFARINRENTIKTRTRVCEMTRTRKRREYIART